ncbi:TetR family transcriptional regulator [Bacillus manliponensis]|uniref:TetR family transcriptional regulator n=1 Tax=Bacillus manliponensis TaxID=574376 RepID=A0A073JQB6_9BACI|nr:TetR-like C-terminal domain-containing protein [Bacillus manliponensis]KEK17274.1 TetR family transcriptional regulator [Bacillus manliponensis]
MSPRVGLTLQRVVATAEHIADTSGLQEVTLSVLAKRLGVRSPSLYNHVSNLHDVRKHLGISGLEKLYMTLKRAVDGKVKDEAIYALGKAYVSFVRTHPGLYEATFLQDEEVGRAGDKIVQLCLSILKQYHLEEEEALHATRGLRSICHGFSSLEQRGGFGLPLHVDESLELLLEAFVKGLPEFRDK